MSSELDIIVPDWPAPTSVRAGCTTRVGGASVGPWQSLNLGDHVQDDLGHVTENRRRLAQWAGATPESFFWLEQVHGVSVARAPTASAQTVSEQKTGTPKADASVTGQQGVVCTVLTADCLPVLFCARDGSQVGAAHAGWRGLCAGVLERALDTFACGPEGVMAWLGPAIGPQAFEVGEEVRQAFMAVDTAADQAFAPSSRPGHYLADLYLLARQRLTGAGVRAIYGGDVCTYRESERFFSYRRDGVTGRMASFIWLT